MKKFFLFLAISLVFILGLFFYIRKNLKPISSNANLQTFVINKGDGLISIGKRLEKNGYIRNKYLFVIYAYFLGLDKKIQSGGFRLSSSLSTPEIIVKLSKGGSQDYWFKIIEGSRVEEIANKEFVLKAKNKEGYLFPDSYLIPQDYTVDQILEVIDKNFSKKISEAKINSTSTNLTESQIIILASILEREGRSLESKQAIAGVLLNRLAIRMPLQVDASVQYARDSKLPKPNEYWQPLSKADLSINSPFNTYKNPGLPPTPICNPGYNSIFAAFHPMESDFLYYITGNDNKMHYAKILEEHNENIAKYLK